MKKNKKFSELSNAWIKQNLNLAKLSKELIFYSKMSPKQKGPKKLFRR